MDADQKGLGRKNKRFQYVLEMYPDMHASEFGGGEHNSWCSDVSGTCLHLSRVILISPIRVYLEGTEATVSAQIKSSPSPIARCCENRLRINPAGVNTEGIRYGLGTDQKNRGGTV